MKKLLPLLSWLGMGIGAFLVVFFFILQLQDNHKLNAELKGKKEEFNDAQQASRKMEELEKKSQELKQKEVKMKKRVTVNDTQPLGLIKTIAASAGKMGLRKISFELTKTSSLSKPPPVSSGPAQVYFQMKFDSTFNQALKFIKGLSELDRIVSVEKIEINRKTEILPYQSVTLGLVTYSFTE